MSLSPVARAADQQVVAGAAGEFVVAGAAEDQVVAAAAGDLSFDAVLADDEVVGRRSERLTPPVSRLFGSSRLTR